MEKMADTMPASTMPLANNKQRFFLVNSVPQFFGNLVPTAAIGNPFIAIEPLKARSAVDTIPAESEKVEQIQQIRSQDAVEVAPQPQPEMLQPIPQIQLRTNIVEPLQRLEIDQPQIPVVGNEPVSEVAAQELARYLNSATKPGADPNAAMKLLENGSRKTSEQEPIEEKNQSIAQAKPAGISVSGKNGIEIE